MFHRILVAINDSEPSGWAAEVAEAIALEHGAELKLLHVVNKSLTFGVEVETSVAALLTDLRRQGQELLERTEATVPRRVHCERAMREGRPTDEILAEAAEWGAQLIVMGTHARSRLAHLLLGSTAEAVVRMAPCPVLTIRQRPAELPAKAGEAKKHIDAGGTARKPAGHT